MCAHIRDRHLQSAFEKLCAYSPIVGIFGHRQVGKTTFISSHSSNYRSLDDEQQLTLAQSSPHQFLKELNGRLSAIDECQLAPELFPAMKLWVQKNKRPGQFLLTGITPKKWTHNSCG